jgi:hypothetical protein
MAHTTSKTVRYVTAFYQINSKTSKDEIINNFKYFLETDLKFIIFTDDSSLQENFKNHSNIEIVFYPREQLSAFQFDKNIILPTKRNKVKDTFDFLCLMNAKPEFIKLAKKHSPADFYIWLDMGILKITKNKDKFIDILKNRFTNFVKNQPPKIVMPGCLKKNRVQYFKMFASPLWRFCGGIFGIPDSLVDLFNDMHNNELIFCKLLNTLTWEINLFASIEQKKDDLFLWYVADHNDLIMNVPDDEYNDFEIIEINRDNDNSDDDNTEIYKPIKTPVSQENKLTYSNDKKRVIILSMIKNETKIIKRMLQATLNIADAICICDTGSTDNTVEVLTDFFKDFPIPAKIYNGPEHLWKNFGYNRSQSFLAAVDFCKQMGWNPRNTYALALDADMQLTVSDTFTKEDLNSTGYKIMQRGGSLEYYNIRFLNIAHPWKCTGVTHEYWDAGETGTLTPDKIFINDIGDGGCKDDKFERDIRLLEQGLLEEPNNPRYMFYLAQTYKDINSDRAIELYQRRIKAGGWYEEVWYSMYQLMNIYRDKKDYPEMEKWGLKAYEFQSSRLENIYHLCKHFRDKRQHFKAWQYMLMGINKPKPNEMLFLELNCYGKAFEYERAILHDYVYPDKKQQSLEISMNYLNKYNEHFAYDNIQWFVSKIPCKVRKMYFQDIGDYKATSTSFLRMANGFYRVNVRYVNYRIQQNGSYLMSENGVLSGDTAVRTDNYTCLMDDNFGILSPLQKMAIETAPIRYGHIEGLEDVRLFLDKKNTLCYIATSMNYSSSGTVKQVTGIYDTDNFIQRKPMEIPSPNNSDCEKNWIPYDGDRIIYSWHPFRSGKLNSEGKLEFDIIQQTPSFLQHMRGSSTLVEDGGYYYGITHCVIYSQPRKYYHMVVKINANTHKLEAYTSPFFFQNNAIEYCLGYEKRGDEHIAFVSQNDCDPILVHFNNSVLTWISI